MCSPLDLLTKQISDGGFMFRRRRSVRPSSNSLTPNIPPALRRANQLIASKDYTEAAQAFEGLARIAIARDGPRAPLMLLQAGRMRILAGQVPLGMTYLQRGLELFAARGQWQRFHNSAQRLAAELSEHGLTGQADQIVAILNSNLPAGFVARPGAGLEKLDRILPANCPGCGAPLHADEVIWSDEITAECPYCGNAVRSE
jgi:hypothetical protein